MILRLATPDDAAFLHRLRNDSHTRAMSRNSEEITRASHDEWLAGTTDRILIAEESEVAVGTLRFIRHPHQLEVSIVVAPEFRGQGHATEMLRLATSEAWAPLVAYVRVDNTPSLRAFERAGFTRDDVYVRFTSGGTEGVVGRPAGDS